MSANTAPTCAALSNWMDELLHVADIADYSGALNGLQVDGARPVSKIGAATDACLETIDLAIEAECDLLVVHHGLFWGGLTPLVGPTYERFRRLFEAGLGLYSCHLPLDAHDEIGNNVLLARALGLTEFGRFGSFKGNPEMGVIGEYDGTRDALVAKAGEVCGSTPMLIPGGADDVGTLAIVTGGGGSMVGQAAQAGANTFLTGEGNHHTYHDAMELGLNLIYAGHYATETLGVRTLAERAAAHAGAEHVFFDVPTGL